MNSKFWQFFRTDDCRDILGYSLAFVFFYYLTVFALVAPSSELIFAVVFEISVYLTFLIYRLRKRKQTSTHARQIIADTLIDSVPGGSSIRKILKIAIPSMLTLVLFLSICDAIPFGLAAAGVLGPAQKIYMTLPVSKMFGFHHAGSLELLAGANVKAREFSKAEQIYQSLFEIRKQFYGIESEQIADIYADFGNLYAKSNQTQSARSFYLKSIQLSEKLQVSQGWGKVLNRLGQLEAYAGNFSDALIYYQKALKMRERIFGRNNLKVAETLVDLAAVYRKFGNYIAEKECLNRAEKILKSNARRDENPAFFGALFSLGILGLAFLLTAPRGVLTRFAFRVLQKKLEHISLLEVSERNSLLVSLSKLASFQKLPALTAQYDSEIQ